MLHYVTEWLFYFCIIQIILGKAIARPAELDLKVAEEIYECGKDCDFQPMLGGTLCTDDFYEGWAALA